MNKADAAPSRLRNPPRFALGAPAWVAQPHTSSGLALRGSVPRLTPKIRTRSGGAQPLRPEMPAVSEKTTGRTRASGAPSGLECGVLNAAYAAGERGGTQRRCRRASGVLGTRARFGRRGRRCPRRASRGALCGLCCQRPWGTQARPRPPPERIRRFRAGNEGFFEKGLDFVRDRARRVPMQTNRSSRQPGFVDATGGWQPRATRARR
jgi:hypothetical protein